jgi:hypothetical protein
LALPDVLLLPVVPGEEPPVVAVGTDDGSPGAEPVAVGTLPGNAGTAGTVGPELPLVPAVVVAEGVTTVVAPDESVGGMTVAFPAAKPRLPACAPEGERVVVPRAPDCVDDPVPAVEPCESPPPALTRGAPPSGNTQTTSRFEQ